MSQYNIHVVTTPREHLYAFDVVDHETNLSFRDAGCLPGADDASLALYGVANALASIQVVEQSAVKIYVADYRLVLAAKQLTDYQRVCPIDYLPFEHTYHRAWRATLDLLQPFAAVEFIFWNPAADDGCQELAQWGSLHVKDKLRQKHATSRQG